METVSELTPRQIYINNKTEIIQIIDRLEVLNEEYEYYYDLIKIKGKKTKKNEETIGKLLRDIWALEDKLKKIKFFS